MRTSVITLISALMLGLVAAVGVFLYASGAEERALADQQAIAVYVSNEVIPAGASLSQAIQDGNATQTQIPSASVPEGALTEVPSQEQFAISEIGPGQILFGAAFNEEGPVREPITVQSDQFAVTLELGDPQRVGGFLRPGSLIAVFNTSENPDRQTRLLLYGVQVLAVGSLTANQESNQDDAALQTALVTLSVAPQEAERLIHSVQTGSLYLALIGDSSRGVTTSGVTDITLYGEAS